MTFTSIECAAGIDEAYVEFSGGGQTSLQSANYYHRYYLRPLVCCLAVVAASGIASAGMAAVAVIA